MEPIEHYSRIEVQEALVKLAKDREASVMLGKDNFGKRPDILQFKRDVLELAKQGATSFHFSEEHWEDPFKLKPGMTRKELDQNRKGFDIILDIDTKNFEYAKITAFVVIEALKFYGVEHLSCKFSGGSGFHIGIPMKALPKTVKGKEMKLLFPECPRIAAMFLKDLIKKHLEEKMKEEKDVFSAVDIDTVLISSRHMFRGAYSINEKSGLVSVPVEPAKIMEFRKEMASPENIKFNLDFLDDRNVKEEESRYFITSAFDWYEKQEKKKEIDDGIKEGRKMNLSSETDLFKNREIKVPEEFFPPCVQAMRKGMEKDGRKRALFILINFLSNSGYDNAEVEKMMKEWNQKNYEPLKDGYVNSHVMWYKRQVKNPLPPNCNNKDYYQTLGICTPDNWCKFIKNPVNYGTRKIRVMENNKQKEKKGKKKAKSPKAKNQKDREHPAVD
jgi:hypothetical protein